MAHKKDYKPEDIMFPEQTIVQLSLIHIFDVQHLAPEGKDCLEPRVTSLRGRAAGGISLDDVNFG